MGRSSKPQPGFLIPAVPFCHSTLRAMKCPHPRYPKELRTIGDYLRKRRLDLKLTQIEVAQRIGASEWTIINWELNRTTPMLHFVPKIIEFLGYNPHETKIESLGARIKSARMLLGLDQRKLSRVLGVDPTTVLRWEQGKGMPSKKLRVVLESFLAFRDSGASIIVE